MSEHRFGDVPWRDAGDAAEFTDAAELGAVSEECLRVDGRAGPVAADLFGVVGEPVDLVFRTRSEHQRAEFARLG